MMIIMVLVWGEKWQMVSWMTVDCVEIDYNMPYPNRNWMWPENQRSNPWRYGICQNKLQRVHVASRCMKLKKEFIILFRKYIMTLKKTKPTTYIYIIFLPNATVAVHSWCILWIFGYNSRLFYKYKIFW